jgi:DNA modification methylase
VTPKPISDERPDLINPDGTRTDEWMKLLEWQDAIGEESAEFRDRRDRAAHYQTFLESKAVVAPEHGMESRSMPMNSALFPHQVDICRWAIRGGNRAIFAAFGLGKTLIQIQILESILASTPGAGLIVCPLGVKAEFVRDARRFFNIDFVYVRTDAEYREYAHGGQRFFLSNYERVRDSNLDPNQFTITSLDESSVLRSFGSKTYQTFLPLFDRVPFKYVCTATPSPNRFKELIHYAGFLGVMDTGLALAQPLDAKILTPTGWKLMGDIHEGDSVISGDGTPTEVVGVFPQGEKAILKITFSDGSSTECTEDHLWVTQDPKERLHATSGSVKTAKQIAESLTCSNGYRHSIPLVGQVQFKQRQVEIDPWLLGVLIGDGCIRDSSVVLACADQWILDQVQKALPEPLQLQHYAKYAYGISTGSLGRKGRIGRSQHVNSLLNSLRSYGLSGKRAWEKRIPEDYLFNSPAIRLQVLRGLMDTDGSATKDNHSAPRYITTSAGLAEDVRWLVQSLGGVATIREQQTSCQFRGTKRIGKPSYVVSVHLPVNPFSMPRKADLRRAPSRASARLKRFVTSVETVGLKPCQCIMVSSPTHLYVTDEFVVTHNTRFFKRDSSKAGNLTLHSHKEREFWLWVSTWATFLSKPSDLGYPDTGYDLPPSQMHTHRLPVDHASAGFDSWGQGKLLRNAAVSLGDASREKRDSLSARIKRAREIVDAGEPNQHWIIWHDLEDERRAIEKAFPEAVTVYGSQDLEEREQIIADFSDGKHRILGTKASLSGSGCNFQRHCYSAIFLGLTYKANDFMQAVHRIFTESEDPIYEELMRKCKQHEGLVENMASIIQQYGLNNAKHGAEMQRSIGVTRQEVKGSLFTAVFNDNVPEMAAMPANSVDLIVTSVPFSTHYEYVDSYNDFGHNDGDKGFFEQMDFLTPEIIRVLRPGRLYCVHAKDRIVYGSVSGDGMYTVNPFSDKCVAHLIRHGLRYCGRITVVTDVVRENNQTYRLGFTENSKDGTKMGVGSPEYILLFRKLPTERSKAYADIPVSKRKPNCLCSDHQWGPSDVNPASSDDGPCMRCGAPYGSTEPRPCPFTEGLPIIPGTGYSRSRWQFDAHSLWRSNGNRLIRPEELETIPMAQLRTLWHKYSASHIYDFNEHVSLAEEMEKRGILPSTFMALDPPNPNSPWVWDDVTRMKTLNSEQARKGFEQHVCLAVGSLVLTKERGYVPIQEVRVGQHALTHLGRWRPVLAVQNTGVRPVVTLRAQGVPGLTLTPDHKVWCRKSKRVREREGAEYIAPEWVQAIDSLGGGYVNSKLPPEEETANDPFDWWVAGRWLADGHWEVRGGASISCGRHETADLLLALGHHAGTVRDTGTSHQLAVINSGGIRSILKNCGSGASGKHLPSVAFTLPLEQSAALLSGYLSGDGHFDPARNRYSASSVSKSLALGIGFLAHRVHGAIASVYAGRPERDAEIEGRQVRCKQDWIISFDVPADRYKQPFVLDDGAWKKVRSLEDAGEVETWNLRVEEDESFTADGCIVKNCPLQLDICERLIERYSNPDDLVLDMFGGVGSVAYTAIKMGRKAYTIELNEQYHRDSVSYCRAAEMKASMPTLFDLEPIQPEIES